MQITITINRIGNCRLPIAYHHIQQSAIYALIGGTLHDSGACYDKRHYKLFTFGPILGRYTVKDKYIIFHDEAKFEVRCYDDSIGLNIVRNVTANGIRLGNAIYKDVEVNICNSAIESASIDITMLSPICVYSTDEQKHTRYYNPSEMEFYEAIKHNFVRKYTAAYGVEPLDDINISLVKYSKRDKYFTKYKDYYIEAWSGIYRLEGNKDHLTFLYNTGIGSKNSQGFGMYELFGKR